MKIAGLPLVLDPQPEGGFTVRSPELPELITEGDTVEEALANAEDALAAVVEAYQDLGQSLPPFLRRSPKRCATSAASSGHTRRWGPLANRRPRGPARSASRVTSGGAG